MKEKIKDILEKHYHGRNFIEENCANDLFRLFIESNPNADWEESLRIECDNEARHSNQMYEAEQNARAQYEYISDGGMGG